MIVFASFGSTWEARTFTAGKFQKMRMNASTRSNLPRSGTAGEGGFSTWSKRTGRLFKARDLVRKKRNLPHHLVTMEFDPAASSAAGKPSPPANAQLHTRVFFLPPVGKWRQLWSIPALRSDGLNGSPGSYTGKGPCTGRLRPIKAH